MDIYRIHGDNIVECERIANIIIHKLQPENFHICLISPSTVSIKLQSKFGNLFVDWNLVLLPGFNKNSKKRWDGNIFDGLKAAGSFFDETPDVIISKFDEYGNEKILVALEFCSALQAGNQAWQRSARAFSTGRTGCPYLYVVDFVKYELDSATRERKNLRFPNAAIPYSYLSYAKNTNNFIAQTYVKSEEFDKNRDAIIEKFDESNFGEQDLANYIVKLMLGANTELEESIIMRKNLNVVNFLADSSNKKTNFTADEWNYIYTTFDKTVDYAIINSRFHFHKSMSATSHHGKTRKFLNITDSMCLGLASRDLPFGVISAEQRHEFASNLKKIYPEFDEDIMVSVGGNQKNLIVAIFKGFKPRGDDNRPDRGLLPLIAMLTSEDEDIFTFIYGPILEKNFNLLESRQKDLADRNGLWCSILSLSNFVLIDSPILSKNDNYEVSRIYDTTETKNYFKNLRTQNQILPQPAFSHTPIKFGEDDVDTGIHYFFSHIMHEHCFEGMCNPPGGDWSGLSIIDGEYENRWLSLPRESKSIEGKRPDYVVELFGVFKLPLLLSIESKEKSADLESDVGNKLVNYIKSLMNFIPNAKRRIYPTSEEWGWGDQKVDFENFEVMSAAAYLKNFAETADKVFEKNCEVLLVMNPIISVSFIGWEIEIITSTPRSERLKKFIIRQYQNTNDRQFIIK